MQWTVAGVWWWDGLVGLHPRIVDYIVGTVASTRSIAHGIIGMVIATLFSLFLWRSASEPLLYFSPPYT